MPDPVPAAPAPAPASASAPAPAATPPVGSTTVRRTLGGNQRSHTTRPSVNSAPVPKAATVASTAEGASALSPPVADPSAVAVTPGGEPAEKPAEPKEGLSAAEEAKRFARLNRAEKAAQAKIEAARSELAKREADLQPTLREHQALRQHFQQARAAAHADPVGFLERNFGISQQAILDKLIGESAKPEAQKVAEGAERRARELEERVKAAEQEAARSRHADTQRAQAQQIDAYKANAIAPVLKDDKYALTNRALGTNAANEVWNLIDTRYALTAKAGKAELLTPAQAADIIEAHFRSQRDLLSGTTVDPAKPSATPTPSPATAKTNGQQTQGKVPAWQTKRPYSVRSR